MVYILNGTEGRIDNATCDWIKNKFILNIYLHAYILKRAETSLRQRYAWPVTVDYIPLKAPTRSVIVSHIHHFQPRIKLLARGMKGPHQVRVLCLAPPRINPFAIGALFEDDDEDIFVGHALVLKRRTPRRCRRSTPWRGWYRWSWPL